jgi:hypothetical protein
MGFRFGTGKALAVVRPGSLEEQWRVLKACISASVIVISQASNTGLTGGSTPDGDVAVRLDTFPVEKNPRVFFAFTTLSPMARGLLLTTCWARPCVGS